MDSLTEGQFCKKPCAEKYMCSFVPVFLSYRVFCAQVNTSLTCLLPLLVTYIYILNNASKGLYECAILSFNGEAIPGEAIPEEAKKGKALLMEALDRVRNFF
ncbi:hypothetical protein POVWA2_081840 [Plasmodium ovale wallikeri]|uniref:Uncharacterized protein n=1 Tax=Plasmodium ovale wallikeri TaxID=864142 RepID=A0A1A9ANN1_PLAOA|nr:hypothetical protein POVWA1_052150 [Plasmodium ovale wallikeri]SBT57831.1 hypothetical protein POVWA2_081840 [Plasmodium ovale wallikeri]